MKYTFLSINPNIVRGIYTFLTTAILVLYVLLLNEFIGYRPILITILIIYVFGIGTETAIKLKQNNEFKRKSKKKYLLKQLTYLITGIIIFIAFGYFIHIV